MQTKDYLETLENQISETENLSSLFGSISTVNSKLISQLVKELKAARKVVEAARNLRAEVLGLNIASYEIMQAIGQTNWSVLKERNVELRMALEELEGGDK